MKEKSNNDIYQIYVASRVIHYRDVIEPFAQYESFGLTEHHVYVSKRKVLVYSKIIDDKEIFYLADTNEIITETKFDSSWTSHSFCGDYGFNAESYGKLPKVLLRICPNEKDYHLYGYFIPIEEYLKKDTVIKSLFLARALLTIKNNLKNKYIKLSYNSENAEKQLSKLGYNK